MFGGLQTSQHCQNENSPSVLITTPVNFLVYLFNNIGREKKSGNILEAGISRCFVESLFQKRKAAHSASSLYTPTILPSFRWTTGDAAMTSSLKR